MSAEFRPGISGTLTRTFINSPLTPLLLIASILVGLIALRSLPREEEPQISRADGRHHGVGQRL